MRRNNRRISEVEPYKKIIFRNIYKIADEEVMSVRFDPEDNYLAIGTGMAQLTFRHKRGKFEDLSLEHGHAKGRRAHPPGGLKARNGDNLHEVFVFSDRKDGFN
jgi:uncharacterized protein YndB with AHSA1/START domain